MSARPEDLNRHIGNSETANDVVTASQVGRLAAAAHLDGGNYTTSREPAERLDAGAGLANSAKRGAPILVLWSGVANLNGLKKCLNRVRFPKTDDSLIALRVRPETL